MNRRSLIGISLIGLSWISGRLFASGLDEALSKLNTQCGDGAIKVAPLADSKITLHCEYMLHGMRRVCGDADGKMAMKANIVLVKCEPGAPPSFAIKAQTFIATID